MEIVLAKRYEEQLAKDPNSRVFAPLGELYRKMGMLDQALHVLREGIKRHPDYILGHQGLAFCYMDLKQPQLAYACLRPLVEKARDNIRLQKLFAECCEALDYKQQALETWKYLLFINPREREYIAKVEALEASDNSSEVLSETSQFSLDKLHANPSDDVDDWIRVDLAVAKDPVEVEPLKVKEERSFDSIQVATQEEEPEREIESPLVSLTLVDLYLAQDHRDKALEVLEKMLELNPSDERVKAKLSELHASAPQSDADATSEEDAHARLLEMVEARRSSLVSETDDEEEVEDEAEYDQQVVAKLDSFLRQIKQRAIEKNSRT